MSQPLQLPHLEHLTHTHIRRLTNPNPMDFQTLTRRELQSLCKLNKIPANLTNVAMAEALQSLHTVVGIEEYLNVTQSETADVVQSVDVLSPQTRCRTSTVTRTTRRASKVEESKNDSLKTPAVSRTTRKVSATSALRNVSHRLSECETEVLVENKYSTRRSTRLTEKKATVSRVRKGAVKIDSILDQGNSNAEVEDICNAFEKLDVVVIEEEVNSVKQDSDEASNAFEDSFKISEVVSDHKSVEEAEDTLKNSEAKDEVSNLKQDVEENLNNSEAEADEVTTQTEDENSEVKEVEFGDDLKEQNVSLESAELELVDSEMINQVTETHDSSTVVSSTIIDNTENQIDEIITKEMEEMSENTVVETENNMTPIKEATPFKSVTEEQRFEVFTENQVMGNPGHVTPFKKASDDKENNVVEVKDIIKKDENDKIKNANDMSMRQLKKLLKAMTLDSHNSKEEGGTKRTALQAVCENQMVVSGGDNEN